MAELSKPHWHGATTDADWLLDGGTIKAAGFSRDAWSALDWSRAYMDVGPSPAGNQGPYWHVPCDWPDGDQTWHRLYPRVLRTKWAPIIQQAIVEAKAAQKRKARALSNTQTGGKL